MDRERPTDAGRPPPAGRTPEAGSSGRPPPSGPTADPGAAPAGDRPGTASRYDPADRAALADRIEELTGWRSARPIEVLQDTTEVMDIHRGHVLLLERRLYAVLGHAYESRFGIADQPKYWVLRCLDLDSGVPIIVKTVFHEEFIVRIGPLRIRCYRSPAKESRVLDLVRGDERFMQGRTIRDGAGNEIRLLDFIPGPTLFRHVREREEPHQEYVAGEMRRLLAMVLRSARAIADLHALGQCHGDIRNDHLILERGGDRLRWIDFDLKQDFSDFDVWSIGNVLAYVVGQGIQSFHQVLRSPRFPAAVKQELCAADASAFYEYRIINLRKLFPWVPARLNEVLMRFSAGTDVYYQRMDELADDLEAALAAG